MYRLAIFDFDGTLADSADWFLNGFDNLADRFGFRRVRRDEIDMLRGLSSREIIAHLGVPMWKVPAIARHMRGKVAREAEAIPLFAGVDEMLERLAARHVQVAVVSSNAEENVRRILGSANAARINCYECGASLFGKPAKFRKVLSRVGIAAAEAIAIGDEIRDIEAARGAGVAAGAVSWGYNKPEALAEARPDHLFASFEDIARLVG